MRSAEEHPLELWVALGVRYGVLCALLALSLGGAAFTLGGAHLLWLWPALSLYVTAVVYIENQPKWLGKRRDGSLSWWSWLLLGPWIAYSLVIAELARRLSSERPWASLGDLHFGRRVRQLEFPQGIQRVIDLTAELPSFSAAKQAPSYVLIPILDGRSLDAHVLVSMLAPISSETTTYVHCAQGHGRTGLVVATLLLMRGAASSPDEALARIRAVRPQVRLSSEQRATLDRIAELLSETRLAATVQ